MTFHRSLLFISSLLIPSIFLLSTEGLDTVIAWASKHQWCRLSVVSGSHATEVTNTKVVCVDQPYMQYFQAILDAPPSAFHRDIAVTVLDMYKSLEERIANNTYHVTDRDFFLKHYPFFTRLLSESKLDAEKNTWNDLSRYEFYVYPIGFSIPSENIVAQVPPKSKAFCRVIPGNSSTYFAKNEESEYKQDIQQSLFAYTIKKAGWDCMRHYEILSSGTIPMFLDVQFLAESKQQMIFPTALALHPLELYRLISLYPSLHLALESCDTYSNCWNILKEDFDYPSAGFDSQLYTALAMATLQYTKNVFSTTSMASYLLQTVTNTNNKNQRGIGPKSVQDIEKVLFISNHCFDSPIGDYTVDTLLHGLKKLLGEHTRAVTMINRRPAMVRNLKTFDSESFRNHKLQLYGGGMTFGLKLDTLSADENGLDEVEYNVEMISGMIANHEFDLVIYASAHRRIFANNEVDNAFFEIWSLVCQNYDRQEVALVDGSDEGLHHDVLDVLLQCGSHVFSREGIRSNPIFFD